ncbi:MAG: hypothetical protein NT062_05250 [Proteobacteria bacterium]|nr:hypothetical protein [Pseudomonadota bacterium]
MSSATESPPDLGVLVDAAAYIVDEPDEEGVLAHLVERHPHAGAALVAYLEQRFVHSNPERLAIETSGTWWSLLALVASTWSEADKAAFLARVGLQARHPDAYRWLAPFFRAAFPAAEMETRILDGLDSSDPETREAASSLAYFLFDGDEDYEPSAEGQRRLRHIHD